MASTGLDALGSVTKITLDSAQAAGKAAGTGGAQFGNALKVALDKVNSSQNEAEATQRAYQLEDPRVGLEDAMIAMSKADVSFQGLVQVRNRLISAYHDIMNMQV